MWPKWQFCRPPEAWLRQCVAPLGVPLGPNVVKETFLWRQNHLKTDSKKTIRKKLSPKYCARSHDHGISSRLCYHHTNAVSLNGFLDLFFCFLRNVSLPWIFSMIFWSVDAEFNDEHLCLLWRSTIRQFYPLHPLFTEFSRFGPLGGTHLVDYFFVNWGPTWKKKLFGTK